MKKQRILFGIAFVLVGALGGYLYWHYIGCNSGTCAITSKWTNSTLYGSVLGYLLGSSITDSYFKKKEKQVETEKTLQS